MSRGMRMALGAGAAVSAALWTLAVIAVWWLLQAAGGALETGSTTTVVQTFTAWTDRTWVRYWLEPDEIDALRDGVDWLLGLGGGPAAWLGTAMTLLAIALFMAWAGGLLLAALAVLCAVALARRLVPWVRQAMPSRWMPRPSRSGGGLPGSV